MFSVPIPAKDGETEMETERQQSFIKRLCNHESKCYTHPLQTEFPLENVIDKMTYKKQQINNQMHTSVISRDKMQKQKGCNE